MIARDRYDRIVLWLSNQGWVADVAGREARTTATPSAEISGFRAGDGTTRALRRRHSFELQAYGREVRNHVRRIASIGCRARMVALSWGGAHQFWYEPTHLQFRDTRSGIRDFAGGIVRLDTRVATPAVWQSNNLIDGIPWRCGEAVADGASWILRDPFTSGYEGPEWIVSEGDTVSCVGVAALDDEATLTLELPIGGATIMLSGATGTLSALGWAGASIETVANDVALVLPFNTWEVELVVTSADGPPRLEVIRPGQALPPRFGGFDDDCFTRLETLPPWLSGT